MIRIINKMSFFLLFFFLYFSISEAFSLSQEKGIERVTVGIPTKVVQYAPIYFGMEKGIYKEEGIKVDMVAIRTNLAIAALEKGELDFLAPSGSAVRASALGLSIKLLMAFNIKAPFWVLSRPEIKSIPALKGKKIGVISIGTLGQISVKYLLRRYGMNPDRDVIFISGMPSQIIFQSLKAGAIDAGPVSSPFNILGRRAGLNELVYIGDELPELPVGNGLSAMQQKIHKNPSQIKRMIRATLKSVKYFTEMNKEAIEYIRRDFGLEGDIAPEVYRDVMKMLNPDGSIDENIVRAMINLNRETGQEIPATIKPSDLLDLSFLKDVQREMGFAGR